MSRPFKLHSNFKPAGDQPQAIQALVDGLRGGKQHQTLLGVTGSGKTFSIANVIERVQRPALVISHNKTLAAQLYGEFKDFFPENAVEYFVSYYDYYLPEAYIPQTDTYIAKDAHINEEIEKLRLAATSALLERRDVIIVASVSCIYGLGSPEDFHAMSVQVEVGGQLDRDEFLRRLVDLQYSRNDVAPSRGDFRVAGDTVDVFLAYDDDVLRVEFWGDEVEAISRRDPLTTNLKHSLDSAYVFPASHFVMPYDRVEAAAEAIKREMEEQVRTFELAGRLVEAQRIHQRVTYDLEMMKEVGYCSGIENYSRHLSTRVAGTRPYCLIDYFPDDFITIVDESHVTLPQVRGMYFADRSRKLTLVDHGFRLPSALDNRPLEFPEFESMVNQAIYVSATPSTYEMEHSVPIQQLIRPTGLLDPVIDIRPLAGQIDDLMAEIRIRAKKNERVLVTTLTKRTAEDLTDYLREIDLRVKYIHSDIDALERVDILRDLRTGDFDCLVGVNLLREGLDLPEVTLVAILDADKEGFLRSETSLVQTAGRAARHLEGRVILYADVMTHSINRLVEITSHRRAVQQAYNESHGIVPTTVQRGIRASMRIGARPGEAEREKGGGKVAKSIDELVMAESSEDYEVNEIVRQLEVEMLEAAAALEFERAAVLRDRIARLSKAATATGGGEPVGGVGGVDVVELADDDVSPTSAPKRRRGRGKTS